MPRRVKLLILLLALCGGAVPALAQLRAVRPALEDALVPIMTGVVRVLRLMQ